MAVDIDRGKHSGSINFSLQYNIVHTMDILVVVGSDFILFVTFFILSVSSITIFHLHFITARTTVPKKNKQINTPPFYLFIFSSFDPRVFFYIAFYTRHIILATTELYILFSYLAWHILVPSHGKYIADLGFPEINKHSSFPYSILCLKCIIS